MEKYAVEIDPKKVEKEKTAAEGKVTPSSDPNTNVPIDPEKGTLPYEKEPPNNEVK
jgi:hypothetical protein